jgi:hypothetical protein
MWTYAVALADNIKDSKLYDISPKTKTIDEPAKHFKIKKG